MRSLRDLFLRLPANGNVRDAIRKFNLSPKVNGKAKSVKELAETLGFSVERRKLPGGQAGRLVQDPFSDNGYCIEVNEAHSVESQRWSVLHEMGHFFLHANHNDPLAEPLYLDRSNSAFYVDTRQETEANQFAAVLLFGDGALGAAIGLHGRDTKRLSRHFGVSEKTIRVAMKQF
ncbi:ImmA/IrrE family metallo-endopeptidase [Ruegeria atlantica]|uniref:ImmA/IrrE family metallo-endopeptidase n=1 Tax=Ruegeria atlantica TaxID=81569 RepID=UPI0024949704|nr:ImmA/IrrE family metallo-endopeptidase [Ruegeria atlantica]